MPTVSVPAAFASIAAPAIIAANASAIICRTIFPPLSMCRCRPQPQAQSRLGTTPTLGRDANPGQILEPALCLHKAMYFRRHRAWIEVVDDEDHHRLAAFELVQLGQKREPLLAIEFVEDIADQRLCLGVFIMSPIGPGRGPIGPADQLDDRVDRIEQTT